MTDYTGLAAEAWDVLSQGHDPGDIGLIRDLLKRAGSGPLRVLDMGCGTGRVAAPLLSDGHCVTAVDVSADQLALCRSKLGEADGRLRLVHQSAEELDLGERFDVAIMPCGTIQLLHGPSAALEALRRLSEHLEPAGLLVLVMYLEAPNAVANLGEWVLRARRQCGEDTEIQKHARTDSIDWVNQIVAVTIRYQRLRGESVIQEQVVTVEERWYGVNEMALMLAAAGFQEIQARAGYSDQPPMPEDRTITFVARRA